MENYFEIYRIYTYYHKSYIYIYISKTLHCTTARAMNRCCALTVPMQIKLHTTQILDTTSKSAVRPGCYIAQQFYFTHFFLEQQNFSVQPLTAHFFVSRQMQQLKTVAANDTAHELVS